ncbi:MAG: amidohydrolase family protein, partial [Ferruginibacter sp.]
MKRIRIPQLLAALLLLANVSVKAQATYPLNDVASPKEGCYAFINANIVKDAQNTLQNATLVIRQGKIESVGTGVSIPKDAVTVDCKGKYIYPSFIDMYSDYGSQPPAERPAFNFNRVTQPLSNTKGAYGWNQAIKSEMDVSRIFAVDETKAKDLRGIGFGTVLTLQMDGISRGTGAIVTLANDKENKVMLKEKATANFSFNKGTSTQDYPNSLMGIIALLRQNFLDAQWYKTKPATEGTNLSLQAFNDNLSLPQIFDAGDKWNDLRADKVGDEFGVQYIIKAGGNEYQRINEVKATNASFIVPLSFPQPMDVEDPTDARFVNVADLKHWEMAPTNPGVFEKAGINFALTANGLKDMPSFMTNLRKAIQLGLSETKALDALTKIPATLIGIYDKAGSLDAGKLANFIITSGPVFAENTVIYQNWIQGNKYTLKDDGWKDIRGVYTLALNSDNYKLEIKGDVAKPTASLISTDTTKADFTLNQQLVKLNFTLKKDNRTSTRLTGVMGDGIISGTGQLGNGTWVTWTATRTGDAPADTSSTRKRRDFGDRKMGEVTYPFIGYGSKEIPKQETILIKNATVWTSEKEGRLENTDVLIKNGKIASIGKNLSDAGARVVDGTGKHLSAGIIDEHSHIAGTGGINECSQSVTAEVRIGDIIDPDDIEIYRQ